MSGKSENSLPGRGDSALPSYENSPRKTTEAGIAGPSGDHSPEPQSIIIYKIDDDQFVSDDEDEVSCDLKMAYLQHIETIRERLASLDIANVNYYKSCFGYPHLSQCKITEIFDDDDEDDDKNRDNCEVNNNTNDLNSESPLKNIDVKQQEDSLQSLKAETSLNLELNQAATDLVPKINTAFNYQNYLNTESSPTELLDLNYNPPKKRSCLRQNTPKMTLSEGAMPLPYHIKVGLHKDIADVANKPKEELKQGITKIEVKKVAGNDSKNKLIKANHLLPKVVVDNTNANCGQKSEQKSNSSKSKACSDKENLFFLFLDNEEQSHSSGTPKSNKTVITSTTATIESPLQLPKRRRIFLRSAKNKVKPIDHITLWEEIRTMEAMNRRKNLESTSSKESYFENVLINSNNQEINVIETTMRGLDVPRKSAFDHRNLPKFPSITKITKFRPFASKKKRDSKSAKRQSSTKSNSKPVTPKVANTLLNLRRDQDLNVDNGEYTPSSEMHSAYESAEPEEDVDDYYQPFCLFCFCF